MSWNIRIVALTSAVIVWSSSVAAYWVAGGRFTHDLNWSFAQPDDGANAAALALPAAFEQIFEHDATPRAAHSPALTEIGHTLVVSWFEGTREGAKDVEIKRVELSGHRDGQLTVRSLPAFDMAGMMRVLAPRQSVLTLGNTLAVDGQPPRAFVTTVSVGGWAMAKTAAGALGPENNIEAARHLPLSPFLNRSVLVRNAPITYADGTLGLPLYHEFAGRFSELARIDADGRVLATMRMNHGASGIQPTIAVLSKTDAIAFLRTYKQPRDVLMRTATTDGGRTWSPATRTSLSSHNSPAAALALPDRKMILAHNGQSRAELILSVSDDAGQTFRKIHTFEQTRGPEESVRYPYMIRLRDGSIGLAYSRGGKKGIRAVRFTTAWVEARLRDTQETAAADR